MELKAKIKVFVVILFLMSMTFSCDDSAEKKSTTKKNELSEQFLVSDSVLNNKDLECRVEITDTFSKRKDSVIFQTSYDYESETYIYYQSLIDQYYDKSTFNLYYPNKIQSLDSLIQLGRKSKSVQ